MENTDESLNLSYEKMLEALQDAKRHTADVVTERMSLEQQMAAIQKSVDQLDTDARLALSKNREDLARSALAEKASESAKLQSLQAAHDTIMAQEQKLAAYCTTMQQKIDAFRTQKELLKAQNSAAAAEIGVTESLTGLGNQVGNAGEALQRAQDKSDHLTAKASALDAMLANGTLSDPLDHRSQAEKDIDALRKGSSVDDDLAAMKAAMGAEKK
jgi:phage shock protein A